MYGGTMDVTPLLSEKQIKGVVEKIASDIRRDYAGRTPLLIGCLTGSFVFMADLIRAIAVPLECDFMKVSSYGNRMTAGELQLLLENTLPVEGRDILIVEDVVDTGASISFIKKHLLVKKPATLNTCVLIYKESERITVPKSDINYLGISIPDVFIVGYGIDCAQRWRELPYIAAVKK